MATRILTADGATITVEPTGSGLLGRLRLDYFGRVEVAVLDRDDLDALAEACAALAEELGGDEGRDAALRAARDRRALATAELLAVVRAVAAWEEGTGRVDLLEALEEYDRALAGAGDEGEGEDGV
jgi:hypothetical protein